MIDCALAVELFSNPHELYYNITLYNSFRKQHVAISFQNVKDLKAATKHNYTLFLKD